MRPLSTKLPFTQEFLIATAIVFMARGSAIFDVVWAQDDFLQTLDPNGNGFIAVQIAMMRASVSLVTIITNLLGATHPTNGSLWSGLHAASLVLFGLALRQLWIPNSPTVQGLGTALIFALFPGINNHWQYQIVHPSMTIFYCLAAFAIVYHSKPGWPAALSICSIGLALGYQIMLSLLLVALFIYALSKLNQYIGIDWTQGQANPYNSHSLAHSFRPVMCYLGCLLAGIAAYYISSKAAILISGTGISNRTSLAGIEELPGKVIQLTADMKRLIYGNGEPSIPFTLKLLQSSLLAIFFGYSSWTAINRLRKWPHVALYILASCTIIAASAISIRIPTILLTYSAENSRVLMGSAVFWSGIFALSSTFTYGWLLRASLIIGSLIVTSYSIITNSISTDFVRLNQREMLLGSRIMERFSELPNFEGLRTVVVIGSNRSLHQDLRGTDQIWPTLTTSMATGLLSEVSGTKLENPSSHDLRLGELASRSLQNWPSSNSTAIIGDVGVVVFSK